MRRIGESAHGLHLVGALARGVMALGLALAVVGLVVGVSLERYGVLAGVLLFTGFFLAVVGCWSLAACEFAGCRTGGAASINAALALICLVLGLFILVASLGAGFSGGGRTVGMVVGVLLALGGIAVIVGSMRQGHLAASATPFEAREETAHAGARRFLRTAGRVITGLGLLLFWSGLLMAAAAGWGALLGLLVWIGLPLAASGCVGLAAIIGLLFPSRGRFGIDGMLGQVCSLTGLVGLLALFSSQSFDVGSVYGFVIGLMLVIGGIVLGRVSVHGFHRKGAHHAHTQV